MWQQQSENMKEDEAWLTHFGFKLLQKAVHWREEEVKAEVFPVKKEWWTHERHIWTYSFKKEAKPKQKHLISEE